MNEIVDALCCWLYFDVYWRTKTILTAEQFCCRRFVVFNGRCVFGKMIVCGKHCVTF